MDMTPQFYRNLLNEIQDGVYFVDTQRRITYWNRAAETLTGYTAEEVIGRRCADNVLNHVDDHGTCLCTQGCPLSACMSDNRKHSMRAYLHHKDGHRVPVFVNATPIRDLLGRLIGAVETFRSDVARVVDLERIRELEQLVYLDELTGIANRRFFDSSIHARLAETHRRETRFGLLMFDVDHFKKFNDRHGHATGDRVLKTVAATLGSNIRAFDLAARFGGEEFAVIVADPEQENLAETADRLRVLVARSGVKTDDASLHVTVSLGATMVRPDDDAQTLLTRADALLYQAKSQGRDRVVCDGECPPADRRAVLPLALGIVAPGPSARITPIPTLD